MPTTTSGRSTWCPARSRSRGTGSAPGSCWSCGRATGSRSRRRARRNSSSWAAPPWTGRATSGGILFPRARTASRPPRPTGRPAASSRCRATANSFRCRSKRTSTCRGRDGASPPCDHIGLAGSSKNIDHGGNGTGVPRGARLRSNPSNLSGSCQRREPPMARHHRKTAPDVVIIGAGVIGLAIAWRLAQRGAAVTVFDKAAAGAGASHAAAGMLAICAEAEPGEEALVALGRTSQSLWPGFAHELERAAGFSIDLRCEGTLVVALTADDQARLRHRLEFQKSLGLPVEWMSGAEARRREPHLAPGLAGAVYSPEDHQVDNRKLVAALCTAAARAGANIREHQEVARIILAGCRAAGVALADGTEFPADGVVLAAGAWSRRIEGLAPDLRPPVRPVKGQTLALRMDAGAPLLTHVVWAPNAYLVPRHEGRLIVGATVEEKGFDATLTAGATLSLLEAAWRTLPGIEELPIDEMWVGHRPGSRDDAPILGPGPVEGLVYATGHYRNGILLTPVSADAIARLVLDGEIDPVIAPFGIGRFQPARAAE